MLGMASAAPGLGYGSETVSAMRKVESSFTLAESLCAAKGLQVSLELSWRLRPSNWMHQCFESPSLKHVSPKAKVFEEELQAAEVRKVAEMLNSRGDTANGDTEGSDGEIRAVELEQRNFELENTIQDLEHRLRATRRNWQHYRMSRPIPPQLRPSVRFTVMCRRFFL